MKVYKVASVTGDISNYAKALQDLVTDIGNKGGVIQHILQSQSNNAQLMGSAIVVVTIVYAIEQQQGYSIR